MNTQPVMSEAVSIHATPALPAIDRDAAWCMLVLADALEGLADMSQPEAEEADEQLNLLHRSNLSALFTLLHDYADAARRALPEGTDRRAQEDAERARIKAAARAPRP